MKAKNLCTYAGLCAGFASMAVAGGDKPTPKLLDSSILVQPISIAHATVENGKVVRTSDWIEYHGGAQRGPVDERVFDCYGDADSDGFMDDTGGCGLSSSRWFFGTAYCNGFATNDMFNIDANEAVGYGRADFGWYWTCAGFGTEDCQIAIFTQESNPDACEADSGDYSGWILNYGPLSCNPGSYYYSNVDVSSQGVWPAVMDGDGSYAIFYLTSSGSALATCAQPMLWGDGVNDGGAVDNPRGEQNTGQLDDDNPLDGFHDVTSSTPECYTYNLGVCPDPVGAMLQFWGEPTGGNPCDDADCNGDTVIDTRDVLCFLNLWNAGDPAADCNGDTIIDTRDVLCYLNLWNGCR